MKKLILALLIVLFLPVMAFAAGVSDWQSGQRHRYVSMLGRAGGAAISGVSVGALDTLDCRSGTTIEFFHAVLTGVSEIWPLAGGGITGWKLSDGSFDVVYVNSERVLKADVLQWKGLAAGQTPYALDSKLNNQLAAAAFTGATGFRGPNYKTSHSTRGVTAYQVTNSAGVTLFAMMGDGPTFPSGITLPQKDSSTAPTIAFGDGDTGLYEVSNNVLVFTTGGADVYQIDANAISSRQAFSFFLQSGAGSSTDPIYTFTGGDTDTGMGWAGANRLSLIAGGVQGIEIGVNGVTQYYSDGKPASRADSGNSRFEIYDPATAGTTMFTVDSTGTHVKTPTQAKHATDKAYVDAQDASHGAPGTTSGNSLWGGATPYVRSAVSDVSGPGYAWLESNNVGSGISVFDVMPYPFMLTGVSLMCDANLTIGISVFWISGVTSANPNVAVPGQHLISVSKSTAAIGSASALPATGVTLIPKDSTLCILPGTITNGVSNYTLRFKGYRP